MIHISKVRVVDENGNMLGEMAADIARAMARERGLDL
ncbi:MAG TPA: translation initiation factor IF-3, partial [Planctomycetota bacterium]|nr:translation initiation factor IF-3 [Planctomycetota bacterium]